LQRSQQFQSDVSTIVVLRMHLANAGKVLLCSAGKLLSLKINFLKMI